MARSLVQSANLFIINTHTNETALGSNHAQGHLDIEIAGSQGSTKSLPISEIPAKERRLQWVGYGQQDHSTTAIPYCNWKCRHNLAWLSIEKLKKINLLMESPWMCLKRNIGQTQSLFFSAMAGKKNYQLTNYCLPFSKNKQFYRQFQSVALRVTRPH